MKIVNIIALSIITVSIIGLVLIKDIKTCANSCCGCENMTEYFISVLPQLFFIAFFILGLIILISDNDYSTESENDKT